MRPRDVFARLLRLAVPVAGWIALAVALGAATLGSSIGLMGASAFIIASAALSPPISVLQVAIVGVRFFGISRGVFRYLERLISHRVTFGLLAEVRVWFYRAIEPLAPARLIDYRSGDLLARALGDVEALEDFYVRVLAPPLVAIVVSAGATLFLVRFHISLALILLGFLALSGIAVPLLTRWLGRPAEREAIQARAALQTHLVETVQGLPDLLAAGAAGRWQGRAAALNERLTTAQARQARVEGFSEALGAGLPWLCAAALLGRSVPLLAAGSLNGVQLTVVVLIALAAFEATAPLPATLQRLEGSLEAGRRLFELADTLPAVATPLSPAPLPSGADDLAVEGLYFRYAADEPPALDGISFALPAGRRVAIVGASGAGKSTLFNLLLRFWDYEEGHIRLSGVELRDLTPEDARSAFGTVRQAAYLFAETVRDNLLLARPGADDDALMAAAQTAQIAERITTLPEGLDTWIGEGGARLSGGERQRLALARALLGSAPILLLDEPAANLDALAGQAVMQATLAAASGRSLLLITHNLVGLEAFDEVLVLDRGRIAERGRHDELLGRPGGLYRRMWEIQQGAIPEAPLPRPEGD